MWFDVGATFPGSLATGTPQARSVSLFELPPEAWPASSRAIAALATTERFLRSSKPAQRACRWARNNEVERQPRPDLGAPPRRDPWLNPVYRELGGPATTRGRTVWTHEEDKLCINASAVCTRTRRKEWS